MRSVFLVLLAAAIGSGCREPDPGYQGRPSEYWIAKLRDSSAASRAEAAYALGRVLFVNNRYRPAIDALTSVLSDSADAVRLAAANALSGDKVPVGDVVPPLIFTLGDTAHPGVRAEGARLLGAVVLNGARRSGRIGGADSGALRHGADALGAATRDSSVQVRLAAAGALRDIGLSGQWLSARVRPSLAALVSSPDPELRALGIDGYLSRGASPLDYLPLARSGLADPYAGVRLATARALDRVGAEASPIIPDLVRTLRDPDVFVRIALATAIGSIGPESAVMALRRALRDPNEAVRQEAEHALAGYHRRGGEDPAPPEPGASRR